MNKTQSDISCDQVLELFALEPSIDGGALMRYLKKYPQFAEELVLFSNEIFLVKNTEERKLTAEDEEAIEAAWTRIQSGIVPVVTDPFAHLPVQKVREIAQTLNVRRQVITAFRERTVEVTSVPKKFLKNLASLLNITTQHLQQSLTLPPQQLRSFKAESKPTEAGKVTFERILRDADLSEGVIKSLMEDGQ